MATTSTALVLGASGGIGGELARQLRDAGWQVRALQRGLATASETRDGIHWLRGDAMRLEDVLQAAHGCAVIVHAVNPPGYRRWSDLVLPMILVVVLYVAMLMSFTWEVLVLTVAAYLVFIPISARLWHRRYGTLTIEEDGHDDSNGGNGLDRSI